MGQFSKYIDCSHGVNIVMVTVMWCQGQSHLHCQGNTLLALFQYHGYTVLLSWLRYESFHGAELCRTRAVRVRGERSGVRGQTHLGDAGLLLLELAEAEDPRSGLVAELLLERVEELHRLPEAGEHNTTPSSGPKRTSWDRTSGNLWLTAI